jgi:hypothetical protein
MFETEVMILLVESFHLRNLLIELQNLFPCLGTTSILACGWY